MKAFRLYSFAELDHGTGESTFEVNFAAGQMESPTGSDCIESWTTVLTGRNGGGKSRTLRAVTTLLAAGREGRIRIRKPEKLWQIEYSVDNARYVVNNDQRGNLAVYRDGREVPVDGMEFPSRIIAASAAANDKFPIARRYADDDDTYHYFGLRDATGRASGVAPLLAALQALTEAKSGDAQRIHAVAAVFELLGYHPYLMLRYELRHVKLLREDGPLSTLYETGRLGTDARTRMERMLRRDSSVLEKLDAALEVARAHSLRKSVWEIDVNFSHDDAGVDVGESRVFDSANLLRRAGLLRLGSVYLTRLGDGSLLDLREASSGQISLATTFLGIAASITHGSLVLIDEPEISLHPEWQAAYLGLARRLFSGYKGCHFVIATHSPSIVSGMPETSSNSVSLDPEHRNVEADSNYGGNSIDELLVREFGVYERGNLFLQKEVARALDLASTGEIASDAFERAAEAIAPAATKLESDPFGMLISSLLRAAARAKEEQKGPDLR